MAWKYHDRDALLDRLTRPNPSHDHVFLFGAALTAPACPAVPGVPGVAGVVELIRQYYSRTFDRSALLDFDRALAAEPSHAYQTAFEHLLGRANLEEANRIIRRAVTMARASTVEETTLSDIEALQTLAHDISGWHLSPAVRAVGELLALKPSGFSPLVLTTNFDPLLEVSIERAGRHCFSSALDSDGRLDQVHGSGCHVVHLHGYWLYSNTLHTGGQLQQERPQLQSSLERVLANRAIVVVGYGGWDDVFTKALSAMLDDSQRNIEILWAFYPSDIEALNRDASRLLQQLRSGYQRGLVTLFRGIDLHWLLPELNVRLRASMNLGRRQRDSVATGLSQSCDGSSPLRAVAADSRSSPCPTAGEEPHSVPHEGSFRAVPSRRWSRLGLVALAILAAFVAAGFLMNSSPKSEPSISTDLPARPVSDSVAAEQTIRRYWSANNEADYATAWELLSLSFQRQMHHSSFADFEKAHRAMGVCSVTIQTVSLQFESSNRIDLLVQMFIATGSSCRIRQQSYVHSLVRSSTDNRWLIDQLK